MPKKNELQKAVTDFRNIREKYQNSTLPSEYLLTKMLEWERQLLSEFFESASETKKQSPKKSKAPGNKTHVTGTTVQ